MWHAVGPQFSGMWILEWWFFHKIAHKTHKWRIEGFTAEQIQAAERKLYEYTPADATLWIASGDRPTYEVLSDEAIIAAVNGKPSVKEAEEGCSQLLPLVNKHLKDKERCSTE